jgi:molybdate transport system regulatory protein
VTGVPEDGLTHLRVTLNESVYLGPGRADLMELIDKTGSISAAGKARALSAFARTDKVCKTYRS